MGSRGETLARCNFVELRTSQPVGAVLVEFVTKLQSCYESLRIDEVIVESVYLSRLEKKCTVIEGVGMSGKREGCCL